MDKLTLWLGKMGTILSDRRAIAIVAAVILTLVGIPHTMSGDNGQTADALVAIIQGVVLLAGSLGLVKSWENRPPSGLKYKEVLESLLDMDSPEMVALRKLLQEAGIELEE